MLQPFKGPDQPCIIPPTDILLQLKHVGFSLLLRFSSSFLTVRTVLREPITEFWRLSSPESCASVGISAPLAHIPVCMQSRCIFIHSSAKTAERRHSQPHAEVLPDQSLHGDFHAWLPHGFHRRSFMPEFQCHCEIYGFGFIPRLKSSAFC